MVARYTEGRDLGFLGEPRVNVWPSIWSWTGFSQEVSGAAWNERADGLWLVFGYGDAGMLRLERRMPMVHLGVRPRLVRWGRLWVLQGAWPFGLVEAIGSIVGGPAMGTGETARMILYDYDRTQADSHSGASSGFLWFRSRHFYFGFARLAA